MFLYEDLTNNIINSAIEVHKELGVGFLEKVYENALVSELRNRGLNVEQQKTVLVYYKGQEVGYYYADIVVESSIIIELKVAKVMEPIFVTQLLNYLKGSDMYLGLLLNFDYTKLQVKRVINSGTL